MLETLIESGKEAQRAGAWDEATAHYETALEKLAEGGDRADVADVLREMGAICRERGDLEGAIEKFEASRSTAETAGLQEKISLALNGLATVQVLLGDLDAATDLFLQARGIAEGRGDDRTVAEVDQNLGTIAKIRGNVALALLSHRSALERYRRMGDQRAATRALNNMGLSHVDLGEWEAAESCFREASELAAQTDAVQLGGAIELNFAELHLRRRRYETAQEGIDRALRVFHRLRARPSIGEAHKFQGILYRETGKPEEADTHFALAVGIAEECQNRLLQAETQMEWAVLHLEEERQQEGVLYLNRALRLFREMKATREVLDIERRLDKLKGLYTPAVQGWSMGRAELKDPYQVGHAKRVADYSTKLARELGMEGWDLTWVRIGALIHDLGNIAVPADVLSKTDALTADEREIMKVHTVMGESMARQLEFPEEVAPILRHHHEQWAGSGYPDQLAGEDIPLTARIVGIADVYDALTSPRSFRPAYDGDDAVDIMKRDAKKMFDPQVFKVFRDMIRRGEFV